MYTIIDYLKFYSDASLNEVKYVELDENTNRSFVLINKRKNTSKKYPRKAGMPSSTPL